MKGIGIVCVALLVGCGGGMSAKDACEKLKAEKGAAVKKTVESL